MFAVFWEDQTARRMQSYSFHRSMKRSPWTRRGKWRRLGEASTVTRVVPKCLASQQLRASVNLLSLANTQLVQETKPCVSFGLAKVPRKGGALTVDLLGIGLKVTERHRWKLPSVFVRQARPASGRRELKTGKPLDTETSGGGARGSVPPPPTLRRIRTLP